MRRQNTLYALGIPGVAVASVAADTAAAQAVGRDPNGVYYPNADKIVGVSLYNAQDCWVEVDFAAAAGAGIFVKGGAAATQIAVNKDSVIHVARDTVDGSLKVKPLLEPVL